MSKTGAIILAAGKGTRMKSDLPKVLHKVAGKSMVQQVASACRRAQIDELLFVVGHKAEEVKNALGTQFFYALQEPQLGTGHAVMVALPVLPDDIDTVFVLCGDTPLLSEDTLKAMAVQFAEQKATCTILTAEMDHPFGYGRILRDPLGRIKGIVEEKDATDEERKITEINAGVYCFHTDSLRLAVADLQNDNAQGEYYLTDVVKWFYEHGKLVNSYLASDTMEILGINDRVQLAQADAVMRRRKCIQLMKDGVTIVDPDSTYIEMDVQIGQDTIIEPDTYLRGNTVIGSHCHIGPQADISDCQMGDACRIFRSVLVDSQLGNACQVGPFCYIRPKTVLADRVKAGHFVELKKTQVGEGSKIPHLSYMGDAIIGAGVNIGCGSITCNYDGMNKFITQIEDGAFIGCNTNLVAPVVVHKNAYIAAGSTIDKEVPEDALAIARTRQENKENWQRPQKKQ